MITEERPSGRRGEVLVELELLRAGATPDSISSDLDKAKELVELASQEDLERAHRLYGELCLLERWLHDR